jgi:dipeptidyl aminopeptidase/acylaminoacyl peptidase
MSISRSIFFCLLLVFIFFEARLNAMSLDDLMSAPFPSEFIAASSKNRIAWIFNNEGRRNIWIADGPDYVPRQLTKYDKDDGQEISGLEFSKDASLITYVRGDEENNQKENPNPTSDPKGVKQEVWVINISGGEPKKIGTGSSPTISPDGKEIVFVQDLAIFHAPADGSKSEEIFFHARGKNHSPKWSPDGSLLAFTSNRDDHSFIGIYNPKAETITWLAPSVDRDFGQIWSPDGKQVAYFRYPGLTGDPATEQEPATPVSIWIADAETGIGKEVWKSKDKTAGFAQYYPHKSLFWSQNRLVFYSEQDGWMRVYSVSINGGEPQALTPKGCEVENSNLTADHKQLIFTSNCNDIDRRHVWIVSTTGGTAKQLTSGANLEWDPIAISDGKTIALIASTAKQPAAPAIIPIEGGKPKLLAPDRLKRIPTSELVEPQQAIFKSADGLEIHGQLFVPAKMEQGKKHPAVIFMHGGPIRQMLLGFHYYGYYHNSYAMNQYLASKGYIVLAVNFRSGIGYGRAFRTAERQGPRGASEYQDILAAAKFLRARSDVDPNRIGLWGGSYGGYLTALGLARDSDLFAAGVDLHGVHDWSLRAKLRGADDWGVTGDAMMQEARRSSPVADVEFWNSPVLFIIGDDDRNVDFIETTDLVQRLRAEGRVHVETLIIPDEVHDFLRHESWLRAYKAAADFFDRNLNH